MKTIDTFPENSKSSTELFNIAIENERWQVEYMEASLEIISEAKRKIMLLMDHYREGKMKEDVISENLWLKMDNADCKLMEAMISISEAIGNIVSEGLVVNYTKR